MIRRVATLSVLSFALAACGDRATAPTAASAPVTTAPAPAKAAVDRQHPRLQVKLVDGGAYDLAQHRGRWVVVNFWATWCGPCLEEMPLLSTLAARDDIDVIGLAYEDIEPKAMRDFLATHKLAYPIAIIDTMDPPADFETPRGLPMTVIIAPDGRVAKTLLGPVTIAAIEQAIAAHGTTAAG
ncbi:TlpA family protein disulfide reductase [Cognatilysobacter segetis]|uniref:TlpA family protein disulfide reductase n=1 Tax=Cognatilysobacter segetis TaxID=2492394 RepID=UPI00105BDFDD|nr:TlpA disulfide reductase family protein [Lysobacter segetis]